MSSAPTISPSALDHVALWVSDRERLAAFLCQYLGMHEIERTDRFTLVGADARRGKLTLFEAEGDRDPGQLRRVVFRVADPERALEQLPSNVEVSDGDAGVAEFPGPLGLGLGLVAGEEGQPDYDIDHVVLAVPDADGATAELARLGFEADGDSRLTVGDKHVRLTEDGTGPPERPLLNHVALLVDSATQVRDAAEQAGVYVEDFVDAPNTLAVFLAGPAGIRLEYVEHKPGFALK
jgi:catechol 2,3-dioxygenase-like lactoylglutathione lyase family enzyme